ncbi:hypothetical protein QTJ16_001376 [Diplocarpon rosae]|uniref:Integral membrane protein n=1 Tax=Diplocarpon rosae TaxID=946125 RepID=A0AAD9WHY3_9HELO|nr:hypothetical protein QTJ16_001376 [Diplocarpon rosae]
MSIDTSCSSFGNCTILAGTKTNGTIFAPRYDESYPVPYWHQNMELAAICTCNSLTLMVIIARLIYRRKKFKRWKGDDVLMAVAGFFLILLYASQLGAIQYGSGLHMQNVPRAWRKMHWHVFWIGVSVPIDIVIMGVPLRILNRVRLRNYEKRILQLVFCATFLGTICCIVGIYGSFVTRTAESQQLFYQETVFVMLQVIEIFAYALGATFPVLSRYIIAAVDHPDPTHANFSSWARYVPDFFLTSPRHIALRTHTRTRTRHQNDTARRTTLRNPSPELHTIIRPLSSERDLPLACSPALYKSGSSSSCSSGNADLDLEKAAAEGGVRVHLEVLVEHDTDESSLREFLQLSKKGNAR